MNPYCSYYSRAARKQLCAERKYNMLMDVVVDTDNSCPILSDWIIQYDDKFEMPLSAQGILVSDWKGMLKGSAVTILSISSLDLEKNIVIAPDGQIAKLVGKGRRSLILTDEEYALVKKLVRNASDESLMEE